MNGLRLYSDQNCLNMPEANMNTRMTEPNAQSTTSINTGTSFTNHIIAHWDQLVANCLRGNSNSIEVNGRQLSLATVVAVSRYGALVELSQEAEKAVDASAGIIQDSIDRGLVIYGVNTGFGGSADTRSTSIHALQNSLMRMLQFGVLSESTKKSSQTNCVLNGVPHEQTIPKLPKHALPIDDPSSTTVMLESWSRASMLVRLNSLASGFSGVKVSTVQTLAALLNKDIVPRIPLRGSISASGDLSPLSYIGGAMQGTPTVKVWAGSRKIPGGRKLMRADQALHSSKVNPVCLGPKEGLAIVNGTAVSAGVAALALHEAHCQAALSQVLTTMTVEALLGTDESFNPFIASVRPHPGQVDTARNIFSFLSGSKLVHHNDGTDDMVLRQDRYSIRTASQWIGPVLEDLLLADSQLSIELNSVTDNPLINSSTGVILHGGNFQAKSVTSAMEKTRASLQTIGRMLFAQCTELINPVTNRGLPPNLVVDDPSASFIWKGTDILIAALASELGFLASPVAPHVQTAEMGNQALNSLALISARYTMTAVDVLTQLSAAHLLALCQALDLRAMQHAFAIMFEPTFKQLVVNAHDRAFPDLEPNGTGHDISAERQKTTTTLHILLWSAFRRRVELTMSMDAAPRITSAIESLQPLLLKDFPATAESVLALRSFSADCAREGIEIFESTRTMYRSRPDATPLLGSASKRMYTYIRKTLSIPFFGEKEITPPGFEGKDAGVDAKEIRKDDEVGVNADNSSSNGGINGKTTTANSLVDTSAENPVHSFPYFEEDEEEHKVWPSVGGYITKIYEAMRSGDLYGEVVECLREVECSVIDNSSKAEQNGNHA